MSHTLAPPASDSKLPPPSSEAAADLHTLVGAASAVQLAASEEDPFVSNEDKRILEYYVRKGAAAHPVESRSGSGARTWLNEQAIKARIKRRYQKFRAQRVAGAQHDAVTFLRENSDLVGLREDYPGSATVALPAAAVAAATAAVAVASASGIHARASTPSPPHARRVAGAAAGTTHLVATTGQSGAEASLSDPVDDAAPEADVPMLDGAAAAAASFGRSSPGAWPDAASSPARVLTHTLPSHSLPPELVKLLRTQGVCLAGEFVAVQCMPSSRRVHSPFVAGTEAVAYIVGADASTRQMAFAAVYTYLLPDPDTSTVPPDKAPATVALLHAPDDITFSLTARRLNYNLRVRLTHVRTPSEVLPLLDVDAARACMHLVEGELHVLYAPEAADAWDKRLVSQALPAHARQANFAQRLRRWREYGFQLSPSLQAECAPPDAAGVPFYVHHAGDPRRDVSHTMRERLDPRALAVLFTHYDVLPTIGKAKALAGASHADAAAGEALIKVER